ncbi:hypothetical protein HYH02_010977 [Chlamydomonas schloesseri]|uniref:Mitochondrial import inner membrane translocase subunit Tim21 n=1 Tax=Chlamydomonas schloesseri TaxID=2026947 RepID=A0A835T3Q6_9CHLO|nr:hypothetical protein HYH02_010977 [Chlamydomonas schloesseri]|eukprot:KAG2438279.1 hypothetical protein HYH02_010977 [Chlamydomonas schloesseri]
MQSARQRAPQLLNLAISLSNEFASCGGVIGALRQGDVIRQGLAQHQRLFSSALASHSGVLGLAQQLAESPAGFRTFAAAASAQQQPQQQPGGQKDKYDSLELTQERIDAITDKIPQRPVGVVEGTSYTVIILAAFGVLAFVLYQVLTSLIFEPTAITAFNATLERLKTDPRITVRIGEADDIRAWGSNSESRVARQQIPHQIYKDQNGVEHVRIQFYIKGPSGTGQVNADMYKDVTGQWAYTYLLVDAYPASGAAGSGPQRLTIVSPPRY